MTILPIDIINKILCYKSELDNDTIMLQYSTKTNKEFYAINWLSDFLWDIKSNLLMKQLYPLTISIITSKSNKELYAYGKCHYKGLLKQNIKYKRPKLR
jgi:hypothetical protein